MFLLVWGSVIGISELTVSYSVGSVSGISKVAFSDSVRILLVSGRWLSASVQICFGYQVGGCPLYIERGELSTTCSPLCTDEDGGEICYSDYKKRQY